jgi:hypothetical protein
VKESVCQQSNSKEYYFDGRLTAGGSRYKEAVSSSIRFTVLLDKERERDEVNDDVLSCTTKE